MSSEGKIHRTGKFTSPDGLSLFYRDLGNLESSETPILCLPGLTRNSKDFVELADRFAGSRRFLCPDLRGRGRSAYDPDYHNYHPATYVEDVWELLRTVEVTRVVVIGTSLGGLMAMIMATSKPAAVAAIVLNDVGPEVDPTGLERILAYVGELPPVYTWEEAVAQSKEVYGLSLPDLGEQEWLDFSRRQYEEDEHGALQLQYDPLLGKALREVGGVPLDPWKLFESLAAIPTLAIRGLLSDVLAEATFEKMGRVKPDLVKVFVPNRGHVPLLNEPECVSAIDAFLAGLSRPSGAGSR